VPAISASVRVRAMDSLRSEIFLSCCFSQAGVVSLNYLLFKKANKEDRVGGGEEEQHTNSCVCRISSAVFLKCLCAVSIL